MYVVYISGNVDVAQWCIAISGGFITILTNTIHSAGFFLGSL